MRQSLNLCEPDRSLPIPAAAVTVLEGLPCTLPADPQRPADLGPAGTIDAKVTGRGRDLLVEIRHDGPRGRMVGTEPSKALEPGFDSGPRAVAAGPLRMVGGGHHRDGWRCTSHVRRRAPPSPETEGRTWLNPRRRLRRPTPSGPRTTALAHRDLLEPSPLKVCVPGVEETAAATEVAAPRMRRPDTSGIHGNRR